MKKLSLLLAAAASSMLLLGCGATVITNVPQQQASASSASAMRDAIRTAAVDRRFRIVSDKPGVMRLAYPNSAKAMKFEAIFDVKYSAEGFAVEYVSSRGLDEKPCGENAVCGHRNINKWMRTLSGDIRTALAQ